MRFRGRWVARGAAFVVLALAVVAVLSLVVMSLWNALVPSLFHGPSLVFWQAAGLLILCRILFGGFRRGGRGWHRHRWHEHPEWRRRWESMTPEERDRLRTRFKQRCGWSPEEPPPEQAKQP